MDINKVISDISNLTCPVNINRDGTYSLNCFINKEKHLVTINNPYKFSVEQLQREITEAIQRFDY